MHKITLESYKTISFRMASEFMGMTGTADLSTLIQKGFLVSDKNYEPIHPDDLIVITGEVRNIVQGPEREKKLESRMYMVPVDYKLPILEARFANNGSSNMDDVSALIATIQHDLTQNNIVNTQTQAAITSGKTSIQNLPTPIATIYGKLIMPEDGLSSPYLEIHGINYKMNQRFSFLEEKSVGYAK